LETFSKSAARGRAGVREWSGYHPVGDRPATVFCVGPLLPFLREAGRVQLCKNFCKGGGTHTRTTRGRRCCQNSDKLQCSPDPPALRAPPRPEGGAGASIGDSPRERGTSPPSGGRLHSWTDICQNLPKVSLHPHTRWYIVSEF